MTSCQTISCPTRAEQFFTTRRGKRVGLFALVLAMLNWFDLEMTLMAYHAGILYEANPIADWVLNFHGPVGLRVFKVALVASSVSAFLIGRQLALSEAGCIGASVIYLGVAIAWLNYPLFYL
ncbi:DUF5658 family protein [Planctomycetes bacterium TBK1r]|uniref:DUF5658 family protein n=1 Tax=Stieleria magnilauensis TaxID=2527963 RepID=UPI0011A272BC